MVEIRGSSVGICLHYVVTLLFCVSKIFQLYMILVVMSLRLTSVGLEEIVVLLSLERTMRLKLKILRKIIMVQQNNTQTKVSKVGTASDVYMELIEFAGGHSDFELITSDTPPKSVYVKE